MRGILPRRPRCSSILISNVLSAAATNAVPAPSDTGTVLPCSLSSFLVARLDVQIRRKENLDRISLLETLALVEARAHRNPKSFVAGADNSHQSYWQLCG